MKEPASKNRWFRFSVGAMIVAAMVALVSRREAPPEIRHPETGFAFPTPAEINSLTFEELSREGTDQGVGGEVARAYWGPLLEALQPSERDPEPVTWSVIGHLRIETKSGRSVRVMLSFPPARGPTAFRAGGPQWSSRHYFFGGDGPRLNAVLTEIAATLLPLEQKPSPPAPAAAR